MQGELELTSLPGKVLDLLRKGLETAAVRVAVSLGFRDGDKLTNLVFFARHPERGGRKLTRGEKGFETLAAEWIEIRDRLVRPALAKTASASGIEDRTHLSPRDKRKGTRALSKVDALVLHQMAFSRGNDLKKYDRVTSHFVITPDGKIAQLHPASSKLWASNGFNSRSVAVEFAGNFPSTGGTCWNAAKFGCHRVTSAQVAAGRRLVLHLKKTLGITHIFAHRQSSASRANDPGPDLWCGVGEWAIRTQGLTDGGATFAIGSGKPIPRQWRDWC